jgi:tRNA (guanine37-N1)-methyltransferase
VRDLLRIDLVTLFPELFDPFLSTSFIGRARDMNALQVRLRSPREFGLGVHRSVDDTPYGGGSGMVLRVDCLVACMEAMDAEAPDGVIAQRVLLTPQGRPFHQADAEQMSKLPAVMLICGRYEGFDERVRSFIDDELSLGDFVMCGGEVAAMAIMEACVRLLPGVLGNTASIHEESHSPGNEGLLEYPQYTRPAEFRGQSVDPVLLSGDHARIAAWRRQQAIERTRVRRPDLPVPDPTPQRKRRRPKS